MNHIHLIKNVAGQLAHIMTIIAKAGVDEGSKVWIVTSHSCCIFAGIIGDSSQRGG